MGYVPSQEEWEYAHACLGDHYERTAARELDRIAQDNAIHESLLRKKRAAEKAKAEQERIERMALMRTYDGAIKNGKAGIDFLPDQKCPNCGGMPYFNGFRFVEHHDKSICKPMGPTIVGGPNHRSASTGLSRVDPGSLLARARRVTGDSEDD